MLWRKHRVELKRNVEDGDTSDRVVRKASPRREYLKGELNEVRTCLGNWSQRRGETRLKIHIFFMVEVGIEYMFPDSKANVLISKLHLGKRTEKNHYRTSSMYQIHSYTLAFEETHKHDLRWTPCKEAKCLNVCSDGYLLHRKVSSHLHDWLLLLEYDIVILWSLRLASWVLGGLHP